jgi:TRAP-type transport system periplasmic protein
VRNVTRRAFLRNTTAVAGGVAAAGILRRPSAAAEFTWRYANNTVPNHPVNTQLAIAVQNISEESGGRMQVEVFPNNQLGGDTDVLSQLRMGAIQLFNLSGVILGTFVPVASINGVGFAFKDYDQVWAAMDGALGAFVRNAISRSGLVALERMWDNGYR